MLRDKDIREPLFDFLEETYGKARILEEKVMGKSRADLVMVLPEALYGIEIKSDADTYARLARQVRDYERYYDCNIVVVGTSHARHIHEHVPEHWGIITVESVGERIDFYFYRKPQRNPNMKWEKKLSVLWRSELAQLQEWNAMPKYKDKRKEFVIQKIVERIPEEILRKQVSELLFERDYNQAADLLTEYRKGEIQKKLEKETDVQKQMELMMEQAEKRNLFTHNRKKQAGHRRRKNL
ncbi:MAG: sce7726 family protein [Fusicatenibacter sp.]|nr:sce7726 family protein [Fusicatenibacter sp.]